MAVRVCVRTGCHIVNDKCPTVGSLELSWAHCVESSFITRHLLLNRKSHHIMESSPLCTNRWELAAPCCQHWWGHYTVGSCNVSTVIIINSSAHVNLFCWDSNDVYFWHTSISHFSLSLSALLLKHCKLLLHHRFYLTTWNILEHWFYWL